MPDTAGKIPAPRHGTVATVHDLATRAGLDAMSRGGNAVDAAIAAALTLGVVDGFNSGIGGGCFILIRTARGKLIAIDGRETAPALATRDMYIRNNRPDPSLSQTGPLAVATPGALAAYELALKKHGRLKLADLLRPAADLAERGFILDGHYAGRLTSASEKLKQFHGSRDVFFKPDGAPYRAGDLLKQPDLAATYRAIADRGTDYFYKGPFARRVGRWMSERGGVLREEDFAKYRPALRKPIVTSYRGHTVVGFPPPGSGGVHVAQILNILEHFDLRAIHEQDPALFTHLVAEAMKLAFADRAHWLGDPDFADVPRGLLDKKYAGDLARRINPDRVADVPTHGTPPDNGSFQKLGLGPRIRNPQSAIRNTSTLKPHPSPLTPVEKHTTHIAAADAQGNWVAITATVNTTFGSGVVVPDTGVVLNNEMDDFSVAPGVPNAFGLVGTEANAVEPGKRPLSSMSPTMILKDGKPIMTLGAAGGPRIITQVVLTTINTLDLGMELGKAMEAPRFHHQWKPDVLWVERGLGDAELGGLWSKGHRIEAASSVGVTQAIRYDPATGLFIGLREPRLGSQPLP